MWGKTLACWNCSRDQENDTLNIYCSFLMEQISNVLQQLEMGIYFLAFEVAKSLCME
jgi:hypothetical protein